MSLLFKFEQDQFQRYLNFCTWKDWLFFEILLWIVRGTWTQEWHQKQLFFLVWCVVSEIKMEKLTYLTIFCCLFNNNNLSFYSKFYDQHLKITFILGTPLPSPPPPFIKWGVGPSENWVTRGGMNFFPRKRG